MPKLGLLDVTTFRSTPDQADYSFPDDSLAAPHRVSLRRQLGDTAKDTPTRLNARVDKSIVVGDKVKVLTFHMTAVIPQGVPTAVIEDELDDYALVSFSSPQVKALVTKADINLGD